MTKVSKKSQTKQSCKTGVMVSYFNPLSDNPNVPVYHWHKFIPNDYQLDKDRTLETSNETYLGCFFFHRIKDSRVCQVNIHETCIDVRIYFYGQKCPLKNRPFRVVVMDIFVCVARTENPTLFFLRSKMSIKTFKLLL